MGGYESTHIALTAQYLQATDNPFVAVDVQRRGMSFFGEARQGETGWAGIVGLDLFDPNADNDGDQRRRLIFGGAHWNEFGRGKLGVVISLDQEYQTSNSQLLADVCSPRRTSSSETRTYLRQLSHVNGRVGCAKIAEDLTLIVATEAVRGIRAENIDVVSSGDVVPQLLESNGRIHQAFLQKCRRGISADRYARRVPFRASGRFQDQRAGPVPESCFVNPTVGHEAGQHSWHIQPEASPLLGDAIDVDAVRLQSLIQLITS